ncbi:hypothetical protein HKX48_000362 [Thoreauomyces humboldtii]|nr:hypothetical protein HKX48_000362 [Thoreauomyces humboldtii]
MAIQLDPPLHPQKPQVQARTTKTMEADQVAKQTEALEVALARVKQLLEPVLARPLDEQLSKLDVTDRAKLDILLAFALNTLTFVYLKTQGSSTVKHPIKEELSRVKQYFKKYEEATNSKKNPSRIDKGAATRFIQHGLVANPEISSEIKKRKHEAEADSFISGVLAQSVVSVDSAPSSAPSSPNVDANASVKPKKKKAKKSKNVPV